VRRLVIRVTAAAVLAAVAAFVVIRYRCSTEEVVAPPDAAPIIDARPKPTTTLAIRVTDRGVPVAARVLLLAGDAPLRIGGLDVYGERQGGAACEIAPNVIGSWNGLVLGRGIVEVPVGIDTCAPSPGIPHGMYKVLAWRGVEYELWRGTVDLAANRGRVELAIPLERAWVPHGTLAADLHVHAKASTDSLMPNPQRVIAQVAAGIQVVGLTDHNSNGDLAEDINALRLADVVASMPGNELSSDVLHAGVYPVQVIKDVPNGGSPSNDTVNATSIDQFFAIARKLAGTGIVQLNHPRLRSTALFDATSWNGVAWPPPFPLAFDAIEVLAGHTNFNLRKDRRLDESVRDFYTFVDHGFLVAPLGNSDTHDFNWILDGTARTYVFVDEPKTRPFDEPAFLAAIRKRRVVATNGPWLDVEVSQAKGQPSVGPGQSIAAKGSVWVDITVERARFVQVEKVRITIGGQTKPQLVQTIDIPKGDRSFRWAGRIALPRRDTWIGVTVEGDTPLPVEVTGTYHYDRKRLGVTPFAIASPILVDVDGDRHWRRGGVDVPLE
jgi:hypothetical protein